MTEKTIGCNSFSVLGIIPRWFTVWFLSRNVFRQENFESNLEFSRFFTIPVTVISNHHFMMRSVVCFFYFTNLQNKLITVRQCECIRTAQPVIATVPFMKTLCSCVTVSYSLSHLSAANYPLQTGFSHKTGSVLWYTTWFIGPLRIPIWFVNYVSFVCSLRELHINETSDPDTECHHSCLIRLNDWRS